MYPHTTMALDLIFAPHRGGYEKASDVAKYMCAVSGEEYPKILADMVDKRQRQLQDFKDELQAKFPKFQTDLTDYWVEE